MHRMMPSEPVELLSRESAKEHSYTKERQVNGSISTFVPDIRPARGSPNLCHGRIDHRFGPVTADLVGSTLNGSFAYDTSAFVGPECPGFSGPNLLCFNSIASDFASISMTINGHTMTVANSVPLGSFAIGQDVLGAVPGDPSARSDIFELVTFAPNNLFSTINYVPGPDVQFVNSLDPAQTFSESAPGFGLSENVLWPGTLVDYTITSIETTVALPEPSTLSIFSVALVALGLAFGGRRPTLRRDAAKPHHDDMLSVEIEASKFPLSLRIEALKRIREKLRGEEEPAAPPHDTAKRKRSR